MRRDILKEQTQIRRLPALCFAVLFLFLTLSASFAVRAAETMYHDSFKENFEGVAAGTRYTNRLSGISGARISADSRVMITDGTYSINGDRSLQVNCCDIIWENLNSEDRIFRFSFSVKVDRSFSGEFRILLGTQDPLTAPDSKDGVFLTIRNNEAGNTILQGSDLTELAELKKDTVYQMAFTVDRGSDVIRVLLNKEELPKVSRFISAIYRIESLRLVQTPGTGNTDGFLLLDDFVLSTAGRSFPQPYSLQSAGAQEKVTLPAERDPDKLRVFVNETQIGMSKSYVSSMTVYISAEQFFKSIGVSYTYDKDKKILTVWNSNVYAQVAVPGSEVRINQTSVSLAYPVRMIDHVIMISPNFINEVFNARVWWDRDAGMLVLTTGSYKSDGVLRVIGGKLYRNGMPYYEFGADADDLFRNVLNRYLNPEYRSKEEWLAEADTVLSLLQQNGFSAVRFSADASLLPNFAYDDVSFGKYLEAMDALLERCNYYGIQADINLNLISEPFLAKEYAPRYGYILQDEILADLVADPASESRQMVKKFLEKFISRYQDHDAILLYELADSAGARSDTGILSGTPAYSLAQLASFYGDCAETIRRYDSRHIVTTGDRALREDQWQLYARTMAGKSESTEISEPDEPSEHLQALYLLNASLNCICSDSNAFAEASRLGKAFCCRKTVSDSEAELGRTLEELVRNGIQLSFWNFTLDKTGAEPFRQGAEALREHYIVNTAEFENTDRIWKESGFDVFDPQNVISGAEASKESSTWDAVLRTLILSGILIGISAVVLFGFRNKKVM